MRVSSVVAPILIVSPLMSPAPAAAPEPAEVPRTDPGVGGPFGPRHGDLVGRRLIEPANQKLADTQEISRSPSDGVLAHHFPPPPRVRARCKYRWACYVSSGRSAGLLS